MRTVFLALSLALTAFTAAPAPAQEQPAQPARDDAERLALAREVIALVYPPERRRALLERVGTTMMEQTQTAMMASIGGEFDAGARAIFDRYSQRVMAVQRQNYSSERTTPLFDAFAHAYAHMFSREDLLQIRAFAATPSGSRFLQRSADLLSDPNVAQANAAFMRAAFSDLQPLLADLRAELTRYYAQRR